MVFLWISSRWANSPILFESGMKVKSPTLKWTAASFERANKSLKLTQVIDACGACHSCCLVPKDTVDFKLQFLSQRRDNILFVGNTLGSYHPPSLISSFGMWLILNKSQGGHPLHPYIELKPINIGKKSEQLGLYHSHSFFLSVTKSDFHISLFIFSSSHTTRATVLPDRENDLIRTAPLTACGSLLPEPLTK